MAKKTAAQKAAEKKAKDLAKSAKPFDQAEDLGNRLHFFDPTDTTSQDKQLTQVEGFVDPNSTDYVGKRSTDLQALLDKMKGGLEGLDAAENTAIRESAQRSIDQQAATQASASQSNAARFGLRGSAAMRQGNTQDKNRLDAQRNLEQDLLVKNVDIKDQRRNAYGTQLMGAEGAEAGRVAGYQGLLGGLIKQRQDVGIADRNARVSGITGLANYAQAGHTADQQYKLGMAGIAASGRKGGGGGGGGGGSNTAMADAYQRLLEERYGKGVGANV